MHLPNKNAEASSNTLASHAEKKKSENTPSRFMLRKSYPPASLTNNKTVYRLNRVKTEVIKWYMKHNYELGK